MTSWPEGAPRPGDRAELSRRVEAADIELFTRISGDRNPIHYDEEAARASRFGEIIVQGGVTSAILNAVVAERLPGPGTSSCRSSGGSWPRSGPATRSPGASRSWRSARTSRSPGSGPPSPARTGPSSWTAPRSATPHR